MKSFEEKVLTYVIGGIVGAIVGYVLMSFDMEILSGVSMSVALIGFVIFGILFSIAFIEYKDRQELEKNNTIRNETVALITHEMRTGLTSTGWTIQMILKKYGEHISDPDKKMLEEVIKSIHTTIMHSVNLLDVSLLDIGKLAISLEKMSLEKVDAMFRETLDKFIMGAEQRQIKLNSEIKLDPKRQVEVDFVRLRIIIENLLENAMQYTIGDRREVSVKIFNNEKDLLIEVADTGIGIPDAEKGNIFTEFYRAKNARKVLHSGSGIGLYTCSKYIKSHNGTISFESEEGVGTTFHIKIPLSTRADVDKFLDKI